MDTETLIETWFNRHNISTFSIYILGFVLIEQNYTDNEHDKEEFLDKYVSIILEKLENDEKITIEQSIHYRERIFLDQLHLSQLKNIVFDISNNPKLLQKDKWSSRNLILEKTNKCIPCKRKVRFR